MNPAVIASNERAAWIVRDLRQALGWTQRTLAARAGVSQAWISIVERGRCADVSIETIDRLLSAMGARLVLDVDAPHLVDRRQRDVVHARCSTFVARRLERAGWTVATEVEVGSDRSRGWIDILAWHGATGLLLVIEIKTELRDIGAVERSLGWYEREAWAAARRLGWRPTGVVGALLLLSTDEVDQRIRDNRTTLERGFLLRARDLAAVVSGGQRRGVPRARGLAVIDPRSRRAQWLRPTRLDDRRSPAPYANYADYADFVRQESSRMRFDHRR